MLANYYSCNLTSEVSRLYKSLEDDDNIDEDTEKESQNKHILISKKILNEIRKIYVRWAQFFDTECRRLHLLEVVTNIGRLVDFYCEKNLPGRFEGLPNMGELVALFQQELMEISLINEMDLFVCCNEWMDKVSDERCQLFRVQNSYLTRKVDGPLSYSPSLTSSLKNFEVLKSQSNCLFAAASRIWGSPEWNPDLSLEENALNLIRPLARFMLVAHYEHLDGFVFEIPDPNNEYGTSPEALGQTMKRVLTTLSDHDPANENAIRDDMTRPSWQFTFNFQRLFITSFAPCYPATSPRYAYGSSSVWILFQPEFSFSHHQIPAHEQKGGIRNKIRKNFEKNGRPFLLPHQGELMAHIYVKPIHDLTDPRVDWFM
jgi:FPC/CPF motif-containing protein YcgG